MTVPIEDLIRAAQQRQAERAHRPDRLLTDLPARAAARRARRRGYQALGTVAAAVAVAAALTVPALGLRDGPDGSPAQPGASPSTAATPGGTAAAPTLPPVPLRYRPTWLPPGLTERIRGAQPEAAGSDSPASSRRIWTDQPVGTDGTGARTELILSMRQANGADDPLANTGVPVDINGTVGYYHGTQKSYVEWRADPGTVVALTQHELNLSQQDMLRIARSVEPDPDQLRVPLHVGWLPAGMRVVNGEVSGDSPAAWMARLGAGLPRASDGTTPDQRTITVSLSPTTTAPAGGRSLTVGGHPARLVHRTDRPMDMRYLVVDLDQGRKLTVLGVSRGADPLTDDDLIRVAEHAAPAEPFDVAWIATP